MKSFAVTNPGFEDYSAKEIEELLKVKTKTEKSVVLFDASSEKLAYLCYRGQSVIKVCSLLEKIKLKSMSDLEKIETNFTKIIPKNKTYKVRCISINSSVVSQEVQPALGGIIYEQFHGKIKADMENPDYVVYVYVIDDVAYIGIDYSGFDLGKRDYRIFANPKSLHANIDYVMLRIAEIHDKDTILDPFCLSGEVGIEAALYLTKKSPFFFSKQKFAFTKFLKFNFDKVDKEIKKTKSKIILSSPRMNDVRASEKNSKIAGVEKQIDFTRQDIEWLDMKFKKGTVDKVVSIIPCPSLNMAESQLTRVYSDFFYNMKLVLNKKGRIVVLGKDLSYFKKLAKNVKLKKALKFMNGKEEIEIGVFEKV